MAFIISNGVVLSFAEYGDVTDRDQRLFESNEGLTIDVVEDLLIRSTERILEQFRATNWWESYYISQSTSVSIRTRADIPALDASLIQARLKDFTDLCVFHSMYYYICPMIADFGSDESAERSKMAYYQLKYDEMFNELISAGDWYNFNNDATGITSEEKQPGFVNLRRYR
mgnify:FL=1|jgi:hypothetical protein|tara:strand:- start:6402 stop:6914 length:513 start_codon:yes stop_codon:yes gene_type:complete